MRNQFFGNRDEYLKYGLLRFLAENGISLFVNWYLTPDEGAPETAGTEYLSEVKYWKHDPELYRRLKEFVQMENLRDVRLLEDADLFPNTRFYRQLLTLDLSRTKAERDRLREAWHNGAVMECDGRDLAFLDPDNGLRDSVPRMVKDGIRYAFASEAADYFDFRSDLLYTCPRSRRTEAQWDSAKRVMKKRLPEASSFAVTTKTGSQRSYVFVVRPDHRDRYLNLVDNFLHTSWGDFFALETIV